MNRPVSGLRMPIWMVLMTSTLNLGSHTPCYVSGQAARSKTISGIMWGRQLWLITPNSRVRRC